MTIVNEAIRVIEFIYKAFVHMLPFFILSIVLAAGVSQFNFKKKIVGFLRRNVFAAVILATAIGAVSPLCSCGVIPTLFALLQIGIPLAPIMSFWITSPLMSPEAFLITWGNLGPELAFARLLAALFMGLSSGFITLKLFPADSPSSSWLKFSIISQSAACCGCKAEAGKNLRPAFPAAGSASLKKFLSDIKKISLFLGGWLAAAFVLEAIIKFYFPTRLIGNLFGSRNAFSVVWAAIIGIPLYINNISAVPVVRGLLAAGMGKGASLAFLLAGPVTTIPAMVAVFGLVKRRVFWTFLSLGFSLSVIMGYFYEFIGLLLR
jgi:hypothetical protein